MNFKHPYRSLSEFDNFKVILEHRHGFLRQLNPEVLKDIKEILQTQWIDSKTRKIVKVKAWEAVEYWLSINTIWKTLDITCILNKLKIVFNRY